MFLSEMVKAIGDNGWTGCVGMLTHQAHFVVLHDRLVCDPTTSGLGASLATSTRNRNLQSIDC